MGLDPDGDSVSFVGLASAPTKGRVLTVGRDFFDYEASPGAAGTDLFTYEVTDRLGASATATVRVGIAPVSGTNQSPTAVDDAVNARPDRLIAVDPLANDSDPDGDKVEITPDSLEVISGAIEPEIVGRLVELRTPAQEGTVVFYYGISDGRGGTARASVSVAVNENAPLLPPLARADVVLAAAIPAGARSVTVPVLSLPWPSLTT